MPASITRTISKKGQNSPVGDGQEPYRKKKCWCCSQKESKDLVEPVPTVPAHRVVTAIGPPWAR